MSRIVSALTYLGSTVALAALLYTTRSVTAPYLSLALYVGIYTALLGICLWVGRAEHEPLLSAPLRLSRSTAVTCAVGIPLCLGSVVGLSALGVWLFPTSAAPVTLTPYTLVRYGILCPIVEELFFRLVPLRLFGRGQARIALLVSAMTFTLFHPTPSRILYALAAGVLFVHMDLYADSLLPSLAAHVLINLLSLVHATWGANGSFAWSFYASCGILFAISMICVIVKRTHVLKRIREIFA